MTLTIELTPEEAELRRRAQEEGLTQEAWMRQLPRERLTGPRHREAIGGKAGVNPAKPMTARKPSPSGKRQARRASSPTAPRIAPSWQENSAKRPKLVIEEETR
jgi:hypothetical protein